MGKNDFIAGLSGAVSGASDVMAPYLMEQGRQSRAEARRKKREQKTVFLYNAAKGRLIGPGFPTPQEAQAEYFGMTGREIEIPEAKPSNKEFFTYLDSFKDGNTQIDKALESLKELYRSGSLTANQVIDAVDKNIRPFSAMGKTQFYEAAKILGMNKDEANTVRAVQNFADAIGLNKDTKSKMLEGYLPMGDEDQTWKGITHKVDRGANSREQFTADEWKIIHDEYKTKDAKNAFFNIKGNADKLYTMGQKSIHQKGAGLFMGISTMFSISLDEWRQGKLTDPTEVAFFDKYYDRVTGEIKPSALIREGIMVEQTMNQIEGILKLDDTAKGMVYMLLQASPADYQRMMENSTLIEAQLQKDGSKVSAKDLFEWVDQIRSSM